MPTRLGCGLMIVMNFLKSDLVSLSQFSRNDLGKVFRICAGKESEILLFQK